MYNLDFGLMKEVDDLIQIALKSGSLSRVTIIHLLNENKALDDFTKVINYVEDQGVMLIDEDIETENISDDRMSQSFQFDSTKININQKPMTVDSIIKRLKYNEINMNTGFQRKSDLWDNTTKSQLIESLMLRIPIPAFYFDGSHDAKWLIIDGLQRLSTFKEFFIDKKLKLVGLEYFSDYDGCKYDDLPRTYVRRMEETVLYTYIIQPGTPENVKFNIFKRINTPGLKLYPQEIRHALYQGKATDLLKRISNSKVFKKMIDNFSLSNQRMYVDELVLRYLAYIVNGENKFNKVEDGGQEIFCNEAMETINKMSDEDINILEMRYYSTLDRAWEIFDEFVFRKMTAIEDGRRNPFNVALYEAWMVNLGQLTENDFNLLKGKRKELIARFVDCLQMDKTFGYDISSAKRIAVRRRIETIKEMIGGVLNDKGTETTKF